MLVVGGAEEAGVLGKVPQPEKLRSSAQARDAKAKVLLITFPFVFYFYPNISNMSSSKGRPDAPAEAPSPLIQCSFASGSEVRLHDSGHLYDAVGHRPHHDDREPRVALAGLYEPGGELVAVVVEGEELVGIALQDADSVSAAAVGDLGLAAKMLRRHRKVDVAALHRDAGGLVDQIAAPRGLHHRPGHARRIA